MRTVTQKLKHVLAATLLTSSFAVVSLVSLSASAPVYAANVVMPDGGAGNAPPVKSAGTASNTSSSSSASTASPTPSDPATKGNCSSVSQCDLISQYVNPAIAFLSALVGVGVVISIIIGGIQYSSSAGDPSKVSAAKARIRNSIIALITFIALDALLNFLIPGGIL